MSHKMEYTHMKIPSELDRRCKLTKEQKEEIKSLYPELSQRTLAKRYNVSRRLIQFTVDESKLQYAKERYKERRKDGRYYSRTKHTKAMAKHRKYKYALYKEGKLKGE